MVKAPSARRRAIRAANDNLPPVAVNPPGFAPITVAELAVVETYLGDLIADIIEGDSANDNEERQKE